ncbi:hypothetical protein BSKO_10456 [Bryopsis sp. KO-2023]|nr:hypothetical protein BSKO_10456 [Bryopsis sp. KO-2023]
MSAFERVEYMDSQKSAMMEEAIRREQRVQRKFLREQEESGKIKPCKEEKGIPPGTTIGRRFDVPDFTKTIKQDPELAMGAQLSRSMWVSNPGYLQRDGQQTVSSFKQDYVWDEEELATMKKFGMLDKDHFRRRDEFTRYVEASAKYSMLTKKASS